MIVLPELKQLVNMQQDWGRWETWLSVSSCSVWGCSARGSLLLTVHKGARREQVRRRESETLGRRDVQAG